MTFPLGNIHKIEQHRTTINHLPLPKSDQYYCLGENLTISFPTGCRDLR